MARRDTLRASEYERCHGCGNLVERRNAQKVDGEWYGKLCAARARDALMQQGANRTEES